MKYLAVKNWNFYQKDKEGFVYNEPMPWIKDWTDKDSDYDYSQLTAYARYTYDGIRRLRGKYGQWPQNDPTYIARVLHMLPRDSAHIAHAIHTLVTQGLLILVDSATYDFQDKSRIEKENNREDNSSLSENVLTLATRKAQA